MDDDTLKEAAELLQQVAKIASEELVYGEPTQLYDSDYSLAEPPQGRLRSISLSSSSNSSSGVTTPINQASDTSPPHYPTYSIPCSPPTNTTTTTRTKLSPRLRPIMGPQPTLQHWNHANTKGKTAGNNKQQPAQLSTSKFVGMRTPHKVKGVLKRKFSWKNFPELEQFLIGKRQEYLHHSNAYNYTATQKEYNNKLTRQLLDLASTLGYIFERFTFVQVRDRVRCYYKSYLQALKKHEQQSLQEE